MTTHSPDGRMNPESRKIIEDNLRLYSQMVDEYATGLNDFMMKIHLHRLQEIEAAIADAIMPLPGDPGLSPNASAEEAAAFHQLASGIVSVRIVDLMNHVDPVILAMCLCIGFCEAKRRILDLALAAGTVDILLQP